MTGLLLDTNVTSELRMVRHPKADPGFSRWAASVDLATSYVSVITVHEMLRGALLYERRDPVTGAAYRAWLDDLIEAFHGRVLEVSIDAAMIAAVFHIPDPAPLADALIAGTASAHGLTVATRNVSDFSRFGIPIVNPWQEAPTAPSPAPLDQPPG